MSHDFESFLLPYQSGDPMIHMLNAVLCKLLYNLLSKLSDNLEVNTNIDVSKKEIVKPLNLIEVGTKARLLFCDNSLFPDEKQKKFRQYCLTCVQYLHVNLPFDVSFFRYAQYLHPEKRSDAKGYRAISNIPLKITTILENCLPVV